MRPVPDDADDRDADEHDDRQRKGDDDVAGHREAPRDHPEQVGEQDEHEQREDEREELPPAVPGIGVDHIGDKLVEHFGDRLPAARYQRRAARVASTISAVTATTTIVIISAELV